MRTPTEQRKSHDGNVQWSVSFPKGRMGEGVAKERNVDMSYEYVNNLIDIAMSLRERMPSYRLAELHKKEENGFVAPPVCSKAKRIDKEEVIRAKTTRFNKTR